jgi:putative addiction module component (TIGR02574 family)
MKDIQKQIQKLSTAEKILLVEQIWESISDEETPELTEEKKKELDRRLELIDSGEATYMTLEEIKERYKTLK